MLGFSFAAVEKAYPNGIGIIRKEVVSINDRDESDWIEDAEMEDTGDGIEFSGIKNLSIHVDFCRVAIGVSEDDKIRIDSSEMNDWNAVTTEVSENGDTLEIHSKEKKKYKKLLRMSEGGTLAVYVPRGYQFETVEMEYGAAEVRIGELNAKNFTIKSGASDCVVEYAALESMKAEVGAGDLDFYGTVSGNIDVKCGVGNIDLDLDGTEETYNYELNGGVGTIEIGDSMDFEGLNAERKIDNASDRTIYVVSGAGDVEIDFH